MRHLAREIEDDVASGEQIRDLFGLSKKAFKRAAGGLLKRGLVRVDDRGNFVKS